MKLVRMFIIDAKASRLRGHLHVTYLVLGANEEAGDAIGSIRHAEVPIAAVAAHLVEHLKPSEITAGHEFKQS